MLTSFLRPVRREFVLLFVVIALALGLGRLWAFDGTDWVWLALVLTIVAFTYAATNWPALYAIDVPARTWIRQALITAAGWSVVLAAIETIVANVMQHRNPYYSFYDWFLVTHGPVDHIDLNGEPYVLEGAGITFGTVAWSFTLTWIAFFVLAFLGIAVGLSLRRWPQLFSLILTSIVGFFLAAAVVYMMYWTPKQWLGDPNTAEAPIRLGMILVAAVVPLLAAAWVLRRNLRNPWG
ncbi:hypothetical protein AALI21_12140 [Corynebacteriaceae bacterium 6-324]